MVRSSPEAPDWIEQHSRNGPLTTECYFEVVLSRGSTAKRVCSPGAGFNPQELLSSSTSVWPTCVVLSRKISSPVARQGPRGLPSPRICMVLRSMKEAFLLSPSPGHWRAQRLNSSDVDPRVWLASNWTYVVFAVPCMVCIHSRLGYWVKLIKWQLGNNNSNNPKWDIVCCFV